MALRDYMQDLLLAQTRGDHEHEENDIVKIIIVDDNSFSTIPGECIDEMGDRSMSDLSSANELRDVKPSGPIHGDYGHVRGDCGGLCEDCREESNRIMLDGFRRRQRFLRATLSPNKRSSRTTAESHLQFSPSPTLTHWSPHQTERSQRDSQRDRMRRLKTNLRMQQNSSLPLV